MVTIIMIMDHATVKQRECRYGEVVPKSLADEAAHGGGSLHHQESFLWGRGKHYSL